ncbi:MAG TPA: class II glutamine amidotransferase [Polyangiaceae bacterium]
MAFETEALRVRAKGVPLGWGLGFYQGGEVLMRRRPLDERPDIDVAKLATDMRADIVIGHVRHATVGALRTENTHPFRYRQWLFAQTGTVSSFEKVRDRLVSSVPEFLRGGIRGDTDAEVAFYVFLSFLHDAGRLDNGLVESSLIRDALRSSLSLLDGMTAEVGGAPVELNAMVSNGDQLVAVHRSPSPMVVRELAGKADAEALIGDDAQLRRKIPEVARMHFTVAASDFDEARPNGRWRTVPDSAIVSMSRDAGASIEGL